MLTELQKLIELQGEIDESYIRVDDLIVPLPFSLLPVKNGQIQQQENQ